MTGSRRVIVIGVVAAAAVAWFSGGAQLLSALGQDPAGAPVPILVRVVGALLLGAALTEWVRRQRTREAFGVARDSLGIAAIIIVVDVLLGAADAGSRLALRSAMILAGVPLLALLTHALVSRLGSGTPAERPVAST